MSWLEVSCAGFHEMLDSVWAVRVQTDQTLNLVLLAVTMVLNQDSPHASDVVLESDIDIDSSCLGYICSGLTEDWINLCPI